MKKLFLFAAIAGFAGVGMAHGTKSGGGQPPAMLNHSFVFSYDPYDDFPGAPPNLIALINHILQALSHRR
jgi:hypothetical protein